MADQVKFYSITREEYEKLQARVKFQEISLNALQKIDASENMDDLRTALKEYIMKQANIKEVLES